MKWLVPLLLVALAVGGWLAWQARSRPAEVSKNQPAAPPVAAPRAPTVAPPPTPAPAPVAPTPVPAAPDSRLPAEADLRQAVDRAFVGRREALGRSEVRCAAEACTIALHLVDVNAATPAIEALLEPTGLARPGLVAVLSGGPPDITVTIKPAP